MLPQRLHAAAQQHSSLLRQGVLQSQRMRMEGLDREITEKDVWCP